MSSIDQTIARLSTANLNDLAKLHAVVYGKVPQAGYFEQKYNTKYTNTAYIGFIAYNLQMLPIAFYGVIPCFISCDGNSVLSAQSADTMTHPDYRNKGLFVKLANHTFELCREEGIKVLFGFPNQNSLHGFITKLNWQLSTQMDCFVIPVKSLPLEKITTKLPSLKKSYTWYTRSVLKKHETPLPGIPGSVLQEGFDGLLRNDGYLQNKTYSATQVINIDGTSIWIKINNGLLIGDMLVSEEAFMRVISKLLKLARKLGLNQLQFHTSRGTKLHSLFTARYKAIESFPVIFKELGGSIKPDNIKFTFADIDIF